VDLNAETPYFYYYKGEKQYLELDTKRIFVSIVNEKAADVLNVRRQAFHTDISENILMRNGYQKRVWTELAIVDSLSDKAYLAKLSEIKNKGENIIAAPYFKNQYQDKIGLSNFFYVKLKSLSDTVLLKQETEKEHAVIAYQDQFMPEWFVASVTVNSKYNAMELANRFYESGFFRYAEPDLMVDAKINGTNDTYFGDQWGLKNIGQYGGTSGIDIKAYEAWQIVTGSGIVVAVLDHGIQLNHPDLVVNIHPLSYDSETNSSPQGGLYGDHGTACAGIIGAGRNNATGIAGVASDCKLMSISNSLLSNTTSQRRRAAGINWAWQNGADIISNSWSSGVVHQVIDDAINDAVTYGRGGLGCVVVFASGNDNLSTVSYPARLPNVIAVGAMSPCGERKSKAPISCDGENWGSNYGNMLDVVAPGVLISTTDRLGVSGYNPNVHIHTQNGGNKISNDYANRDYTVWFNGTSAATPHVAGVAALILSVNPNLTQAQVTDIIESTARKVGNYSYTNTSGRPNGTWNNQMGYGLIDAEAAVTAARKTLCTVEYTATVSSQTINTEVTVNGSTVNIQNTNVTTTGKLDINACNQVNIGDNFSVSNGATLSISVGP
jgi:subtilisin family serine protease